MTSYPILSKGANVKAAEWFYMPKKRIYYWRTGVKGNFVPHIQFFGLSENESANVDNIRDLAEAIHEAINFASNACGLRKQHNGLAMHHTSEIAGTDDVGENTIWSFPVFATDKDRAVIYVKVYTDAVHGGSCVIWCKAFVMTDIPSASQLEVMLNTALQHAETMVKKYTRKNLP